MLYGWYGSDGPRDNDGMLTASTRPPEVQYITFDTQLPEGVTAAIASSREFNDFDFGVSTEEETPSLTTASPTTAYILNDITLGVISGVVLGALLVVLVIVLVCVFGRRRRDNPRPKR